MKLFKILVMVSVFLSDAGVRCKRTKRSFLDLGRMISLTTGRRSLDFDRYGHFCGLGGSGRIQDSIDWCCQQHDRCYNQIQYRQCHTYTNKYNWEVINNNIVCQDNPWQNSDENENEKTEDTRGQSTQQKQPNRVRPTADFKAYCHLKACECDRWLAHCLGRYHIFYNPQFAPRGFSRLMHGLAHFVTFNRF